MNNKSVSVRISSDTYEELKILCMLNDKNIKEMLTECVKQYQECCENSMEMKNLKHQIYRLKYDSHEKDK